MLVNDVVATARVRLPTLGVTGVSEYSPICTTQVRLCIDWIECEMPCSECNSDQLADIVSEFWDVHVTNGSFIAAAVGLGNQYCILDDGNIRFPFSLSAVQNLSIISPIRLQNVGSVVKINFASPRDLRRIIVELKNEYDNCGESFIVNSNILHLQNLFTLSTGPNVIGFLLVCDAHNGNYNPMILNIWPPFRRRGFGSHVMCAIETCMYGKTMSFHVSGVVGCDKFYKSLGYSVDVDAWHPIAIKRV
jgi:hypothetical protein